MVSKSKVLSTLIIVISVFSLCSCGKDMPEKTSVSGFYFDTVISLTFYGENAEKAADSCLEKAAYYDGLLNKSIESSDIYRINHSKGETVIVSVETAELLSFCTV